MARTTWSARSYLTPLFQRLGISVDGTDNIDTVISYGAGTVAPTATAQPYVAGSVHAAGGSDPGIWQRTSSGWLRVALQLAAATFTTLTATGVSTLTKLKAGAVTELTIASGVITVTQWSHTVDTQSDASTDDLDTISGGSGEQLLVIRPASDARSVVIKHMAGNIQCPDAEDITLAEDDDMALLWWNGTTWTVIGYKTLAKSGGGIGSALASASASKGASLVAIQDAATLYPTDTVEAALAANRTIMLLKAATELTIASGVITATQSLHSVDTESDAASDDLDTINGGSTVPFLFISPISDARSVVLKHGTGNIECPGGVDLTLAEDDDFAMLVWNGTKWAVLAYKTLADRSTFGKFTSAEQTGTGSSQNIPHSLGTTPAMVWATITEAGAALAGGLDIAAGAHDATNAVFTVTSGLKYVVYAIK